MHSTMKANLLTKKTSRNSRHARPYVKRDDVDASIVLEVTVVSDKLTLNVYWAANHRGAT